MKVIDLLNKIAKGEEVPKRIKDGAFELTLDRDGKHYGGQTTTVLNSVFGMERLNDEIEIIEEEKDIEKLDYCEENTFSNMKESTYLSPKERRLLDSNFKELGNKINELIDIVKELKNEK